MLALPPGTEAGGLARDGLVVARHTGGDEALLIRPDGYYAWAGAPRLPVVEAGLAPWTTAGASTGATPIPPAPPVTTATLPTRDRVAFVIGQRPLVAGRMCG